MSFTMFISKRYVKINKKINFTSIITIISCTGIAVGVMTLIIMLSIVNGFESNLRHRILEFNQHILITKVNEKPIDNHSNIIKKLNSITNIDEISTFVSAQVIISTKKTAIGSIMKGIQNHEKFASNHNSKSIFNDIDCENPTIVISTEIMENLKVKIGDIIYITSPIGIASFLNYIPYTKKFRIIGFYQSNCNISNCYIDEKEAQRLLQFKDLVTGIEIKLKNVKKTDEITNKIYSKIDKDLSISNWKQMNMNLFSAIKLEKTVTLIIIFMLTLLTTFNITTALAMSVFEKKKEIAILKIMGASNKDISRIFIWKGMIIGITGTLLGTFIGILMSTIISIYPIINLPVEIYYISKLPVNIKINNIILVIVSSLLISFLASIYPAIKASNEKIITAIT